MGNPVVHFEIIGKDVEKLQTFYSRMFGWKINANNPMKYGIVDTDSGGKGIAGGIGPAMEGPSYRTAVYAQVPSIDKALAEINASGGTTTMPKAAVPGGPTIAMFTDPEGRMIGLVQAGTMRNG